MNDSTGPSPEDPEGNPRARPSANANPPALLPFRLSICGLDELPDFARADVSHVVSILDPTTPDPAVLKTYGPHLHVTYRFDDVIREIPGFVPPMPHDVERILAFGENLHHQAVRHLLIHCHAGVSRSTAMAAILMAQAKPGQEEGAFAFIRQIRPRSWPNSRMIDFADSLLGRGGEVKAALARHLEHITRSHPDLAELVRIHGRAHEVPGIAKGPPVAAASPAKA